MANEIEDPIKLKMIETQKTATENCQTSESMMLQNLTLSLNKLQVIAEQIRDSGRKEQEQDKGRKLISSPLSVAIITGIIGLIGAAVATILQSNASLNLEKQKFQFGKEQEKLKNDATIELERQKFESTLVLKAIETGDPKIAARNIQFLVDANYLRDAGGKIAKYIKEPEAGNGPVLPRSGASVLPISKQQVLDAKDPFGNSVRALTWTDDRRIDFLDDWDKKNIEFVYIPELKGVQGFPESGKVAFNKNAADALRKAWAEVAEKNLIDRVLSWDGAYAPIKGGANRISSHAYGVAFDINASKNPLGANPLPIGEKGSVRELVPIFEKYEFRWNGNLKRPDGMHFEYAKSTN